MVFAATTMFPSTGLQVLSCMIQMLGMLFTQMRILKIFRSFYLKGVSVLSHCVSRSISADKFPTWSSYFESWPRFCIVLAFIDSWLFVFSGELDIGLNDIAISHEK